MPKKNTHMTDKGGVVTAVRDFFRSKKQADPSESLLVKKSNKTKQEKIKSETIVDNLDLITISDIPGVKKNKAIAQEKVEVLEKSIDVDRVAGNFTPLQQEAEINAVDEQGKMPLDFQKSTNPAIDEILTDSGAVSAVKNEKLTTGKNDYSFNFHKSTKQENFPEEAHVNPFYSCD